MCDPRNFRRPVHALYETCSQPGIAAESKAALSASADNRFELSATDYGIASCFAINRNFGSFPSRRLYEFDTAIGDFALG